MPRANATPFENRGDGASRGGRLRGDGGSKPLSRLRRRRPQGPHPPPCCAAQYAGAVGAPFDSDCRETIPRAIHASGRHFVIALTGGGSGAIGLLLQTPGASRSVLEAIVPYALPALADWLGGVPDQACSAPTARAMAMAAFERAR